MMKKALFLDRDGTLIVDKHYLKDPKEIEIFPGVSDFLKKALACDYLLFLFTNQSGISRGLHTLDDAHACNKRMLDLLNLPEPGFMEIKMAIEAPHEEGGYRKPSPRFICEMIEKYNLDPKACWMIGDKLSDLEAGIKGGICSAWVASGKPRDEELDAYIKEHEILTFSHLNGTSKLFSLQRSSLFSLKKPNDKTNFQIR